jgi:hypothetical protein
MRGRGDLFIDRSQENNYCFCMTISHQTVLDKDGQPTAAIIPWGVFEELQELVDGSGPTPKEKEAMLEAEADRLSGNENAFVTLTELEEELSL